MSKPFVTVRGGKLFDGKKPVTIAELMGLKPDDQGKHTGSIIFIDDEGGTKDGDYFEDTRFRRKGKHRATVFHASVAEGRRKLREYVESKLRNERIALSRGWTRCVCGDPECGAWFPPGSNEWTLGVPDFLEETA